MTTGLPILTFHALDEADAVISCAPHVFQAGLALLHGRGYRTLTLSEALRSVREPHLSDRAFVLTFDDGFQTVYTEAFPILQRYGMGATVFLTGGPAEARHSTERLPAFEGRSSLSWPEIREMQKHGIEFGAHTLSHPDLTRLPEERIAHAMSASKASIEDALGVSVTSFAYPFGRFDAQCHRIAQRYFSCACADTLGLISAKSDPFALERVDAYYLRTERLFSLTVSTLFPWYILARNVPRSLRRRFLSRQKKFRTR